MRPPLYPSAQFPGVSGPALRLFQGGSGSLPEGARLRILSPSRWFSDAVPGLTEEYAVLLLPVSEVLLFIF